MPDTVALTEAGQEVEVRLVHPDDPALVPTELDLTTVGDEVATLEHVGDGVVRITAGEGIGASRSGARVAPEAEPALLDVSTVRLVDGVVPIADDQVVFPQPGIGLDDLAELGPVDGVDDEGVGPFTWAEVAARLEVPEGVEGDPMSMLGDEGRVPWVLTGAAPTTGTVLFGVGASGLAGRVVEPEGLPTLERDGQALVTVELVGLDEVYLELHVSQSTAALTAAGIGPEPLTVVVECAEGDPSDCEVDGGAERPAGADGAGPSSTTAATSSVPTATGATAASPASFGPMAEGDAPSSQFVIDAECQAALAGTGVDINLSNGETRIDPAGDFLAIRTEERGVERFWVEMGYDTTASIAAVLKIVGSVELSQECKLHDLGSVDIKLPGAVAPFLALKISAAITAGMGVKVEGGPSASVEAKCEQTRKVRVGFRYDIDRSPVVDPYKVDESSDSGCPGEPKVNVVPPADGQGVPVTVEATAGANLAITLAGTIPGVGAAKVKDWLAKYFDVKLSDIEFLQFKGGLRMRAVWENTAAVLAAQGAGATIAAELVVAAVAGLPSLDFIAHKLTRNPNISLSITLAQGVTPLGTFYRSPGPTQVKVDVDGRERFPSNGVVEVTVDADVTITAPLTYPPVPLAVVDKPFTEGMAYIQEDGDWVRFDELSGARFRNTGTTTNPVVAIEATITEEVCERIGEHPKAVALVPTADFYGLPGHGWAGTFPISCRPAILEWDPTEVGLDVEDLTDRMATVDVDLGLIGGGGWDWELFDLQRHPAWLSVSPLSGTFGDDNGNELDTVAVQLSVDCGATGAPEGVDTGYVSARTVGSGMDIEAETVLPVTVDCSPGWIRTSTPELTGSGTITVTSEGIDPDTFEVGAPSFIPGFVGALPDWMSVAPMTGALPGDGERATRDLAVSVQRRPQPDQTRRGSSCLGYLPIRSVPNETASVRVLTEQREHVDIVVVREGWPGKPAIAPNPSACSGPGGASGDPHMTSMDGLRYDAQVVGEYDLLVPREGEDGPQLQARMELTRDGGPHFARPTSITGVVLHDAGHTIEVHSRPHARLVVDGEPVDMTAVDLLEVGDGVNVSFAGPTYTIRTPSITVSANTRGGIIGLATYTDQDPDLEGLLGVPDGEQGNDLVGRDGTVHDIATIRQHGPELFAFTDSWRLTDVADSRFSETYAGFADPNPVYDRDAILGFVPQVVEALGALNSVCDGEAEEGNYVVDALAIELAIGGQLGDLGEYTCSYLVQGTATTELGDGSTAPVAGLPVTVTHPSFETCEAVTAPDGRFDCRVWPDLAALPLVPPAELPLTFQVEARWPDDVGVAGTATAVFAERAGVEESALSESVSLAVDPLSFPVLDLEGTIHQWDEPYTGFTTFEVTARDERGVVVASLYPRLRPGADGSFVIRQGLPRGTTQVELRARIGDHAEDAQTTTVDGLVPGSNPVTWELHHDPPLLRLAGTMVGVDGAGLPGPITIEAQGAGPGAPMPPRSVLVHPDPATGAYSTDLVLPRLATSATLTAEVGAGQSDWRTLELAEVVPGAQDVTFDVSYEPASVELAGTITKAGEPYGEAVDLQVVARGAVGELLGVADLEVVPDAAGAYTATTDVPQGTATVDLVAQVGLIGTDWVRATVPVAPEGATQVPFDVAHVPTVVTLTGTMVDSQGPYAGEREVHVTASNLEGLHYTATVPVGVRPDGTVVPATFELPRHTTQVQVRAQLRDPGVGAWFVADRLVDPAELNDLWLAIESTVIEVSGSFLFDGQPTPPDPSSVGVTVRSFDGTAERSEEEVVVEVAPDGTYSLVRAVAPGADRATLRFDVGRGHEVELVGLGAGSNARPGIDVEFAATALRLSGDIIGPDGERPAGAITIGVRALDPAISHDLPGPWNELAYLPATVVLGPGDAYTADVDLPAGTTLAEAVVFVDGQAVPGLRRAVRVERGVLTEAEVDLTWGGPRGVRLTGRSFMDPGPFCVGEGPMVFNLTIRAFTSEPSWDDYDPGADQWSTGTEVLRTVVVPDLATERYDLAASLPEGTTHVLVEADTDGIYSIWAAIGSLQYDGGPFLEVDAGGGLVRDADLSIACAF